MPTNKNIGTYWKIAISISLLIAGSIIYLLFRQDAIFLQWIDIDILHTIHIPINYKTDNVFLYLLLFCIPDGFWYAALLVIQALFNESDKISRILYFISVILPFIMETFQYFHCIPGTFDWFDLYTYFITLITFRLCKKNIFFKF